MNNKRSGHVPSIEMSMSQARLMYAHGCYRQLTDDERQQWRDYAATLLTVNPKTRLASPRQGDKVFVGLACRFQHVNRGYPPIPRTPPPFPFAGDPITVTAQATATGVRFTASGVTSAAVRVELLLQRLPSPARMPQPGRYRTQAFAEFTAEGLTANVTIMRGWYIPAYRFVSTATGQDTPLFVLPKVTVGL